MGQAGAISDRPLGGRSALVADDDEDSRTLLSVSLRRAGFQVIEASDGEELLACFAAMRRSGMAGPSVVISDIGMPGCDGIQATQLMRNDSPVPIVLVTAFHDAETLDSARSAGADLVLCKPIDDESLVHAVLDLTTPPERESKVESSSSSRGDASELCSDVLDLVAIDDDEIDLETLRRAYEQVGGNHELRVARDRAQALALLRDHVSEHTVALLDLDLPGDGLDFLREIRRDPMLRSLRVVILTSSNDMRQRREAYALNVAGYLVKPVTFQRFRELIRVLDTYLRALDCS